MDRDEPETIAMEEAERIAVRLSPTQKRAIIHLGNNDGWGKGWRKQTRYALFERGLVAASRLTVDGLAVRALLKGE